jgi:hypothetical protein
VSAAHLSKSSLQPSDTKTSFNSGKIDKQDFVWVYNNLYAKGVTPESAPSHGAFALWDLCQTPEGKKVFFLQYFPRISIETLKGQDRFADDNRDLTEQIDKLLRVTKESIASAQ